MSDVDIFEARTEAEQRIEEAERRQDEEDEDEFHTSRPYEDDEEDEFSGTRVKVREWYIK